jgi:crotonobetainyl-CoA:carnitine CoA-transferase CaiB-like acyl-CoA transferase
MSIANFKLRAIDLSMGWAGPLVTQILAFMGAQVIKVEDTLHFDWWRGSRAMAPPEMQPLERASVFNTVNRGKLGCTLDLSRARGLDLLKRMIAVSDLLVENFSVGVIDRLGLDFTTVSAINPRLIMVSMPIFGAGGPDSQARGYGMTVEAMAGVTNLCRYEPGGQPYTLSNALGDPVSGLTGALAVLGALHQRNRTGRGQLIEIAQVETAIPFLAAGLVDLQLSGREPTPAGNRHCQFAPHGIFRCAGDESWIAIAIETEAQWQSLVAVLGAPELALDSRFADQPSRKGAEVALNEAINQRTVHHQAEQLAARLNAAAIAASPVNSAAAVLSDDHLHARGFFVPVDRAVVGTFLYPGAVPRLSGAPLSDGDPAPTLGEHNSQVLRDVLGLGENEFAELERAGIIGASPR